MEKLKRRKLFAFILIVGTILRFTKLDFQSFWYEELVSVYYTNVNGLGEFFSRYLHNPDFSPPLYHLFIYFIRSLFGSSDWILRAPSAFFGVGVIVMTYFLGRRLISQQGALMASAMASVSGAFIYYSQEMRYNTALVFFILLYSYLFLDYQHERSSIRSKIGLTLSVFILVYIHYLGLFFVLQILVVSTMLKRTLWKRNVIFMVGVIILFAPWMMVFIKQTSVWSIPNLNNTSPHLFTYLKHMLEFAFFYRPYWFSDNIQNGNVYILMYASAGFLFISMLFCLRKNFRKLRCSLEQFYLWGLFIFNVSLFFIADLLGSKKYFYEKNLLFTLPFLYLGVAFIIDRAYSSKKEKHVFILGCSLFMAYRPFYVLDYYGRVFKTEFKTSAEIIARDYKTLPVFVMCGDREWYDHYFTKMNIKNVTYIKNAEDLHREMKNKQRAVLTYGHCFVDPLVEFESEKYLVKSLYQSHSLSFAGLYEFHP